MVKKFVIPVLIIFFAINSVIGFSAFADEFYEGQPSKAVFSSTNTDSTSNIPRIDAAAAIVIDTKSGRVLFEKNAYSKRAMASTTKIMTAILAIENGNLEDVVTVSKRAASVWGSTIDLQTGQKLKLRELLYGLMLNSGNDAAIAIAEHIGGSVENFCEMMNKKALELGAKDTCFKSPHGLDIDGHHTTAYDMAIITKYALQDKTFSKIVGTLTASIPGRGLYNTNELLGIYQGADGVKTGYTGKAGRCLVSSATRDGWRIIAVVLGCATRTARAQSSRNILDYAFDNYKLYKLIVQDQKINDLPVIKGIRGKVSVKAVDGVEYPLKKEELDALEKYVELPESLNAPVRAGIEIGSIKYLLNGKVIAETQLKTGLDVERKGVIDYMGEFINEWSGLMKN